ncbi:hypothetical protein SERLADRAFT_456874 [Serpula lacrymans var. lacrymans S7.9]|uniref:Uncharacterized protein n=1 Tax=Serpula lacrymans var. lacrymans (strain S7.9) TaxID=578457 RepID=F8NJ22_SERL9|nr:uncharacterized protein SERLADRAFT_456874 [Serpula lacrymans var. lacrymans S7.9]EGO29303.1 hypothetical protein SERLADRAFT_456874 [Serpula lacrymans var. lacrymans S7.9]
MGRAVTGALSSYGYDRSHLILIVTEHGHSRSCLFMVAGRTDAQWKYFALMVCNIGRKCRI